MSEKCLVFGSIFDHFGASCGVIIFIFVPFVGVTKHDILYSNDSTDPRNCAYSFVRVRLDK